MAPAKGPARVKKIAPIEPLSPIIFVWAALGLVALAVAASERHVVSFLWDVAETSGLLSFLATQKDAILKSETGQYLFEGWQTYSTQHWPTMNPMFVFGSVMAYVFFVLAGRAYMRSRPAFSIKPLIRLYNLSIASVSIYMVVTIILEHQKLNYNLFCNPAHESHTGLTNVIFVFFISKCFEFLDTVCSGRCGSLFGS
jgi:hypothetical protein